MKGQAQPIAYLWWLISRASGVVALVLVSLSVAMGLAMAAKVMRRPSAKRALVKLHEHTALTALLAIATHGASLLRDHWLKPGLSGITVPFAIGYRPQFIGLGIISGYVVVLLGPSFYLRRRIGARRWRRVHGVIVVAWLLSVVHTLGAGSDSHRLWLRALVFVPVVPIAYLFVLRLFRGGATRTREAAPRTREAAPRASASARRTAGETHLGMVHSCPTHRGTLTPMARPPVAQGCRHGDNCGSHA